MLPCRLIEKIEKYTERSIVSNNFGCTNQRLRGPENQAAAEL
jgi:hypothetical protein